MQLIIEIILAIVAIYGAALSTINQLQARRQTQRRLSVNMKLFVEELPRVPTDQGGHSLAPVYVFIIQVVNSGLLPVLLKSAGILFPDGTYLTKAFSPRRDKQFPLELAPGDDHEVHIDAYDVLRGMKGNSISKVVVVRGCFMTPLKQYESKKVHLNVEDLANKVKSTEGAWRKVPQLKLYPVVDASVPKESSMRKIESLPGQLAENIGSVSQALDMVAQDGQQD